MFSVAMRKQVIRKSAHATGLNYARYINNIIRPGANVHIEYGKVEVIAIADSSWAFLIIEETCYGIDICIDTVPVFEVLLFDQFSNQWDRLGQESCPLLAATPEGILFDKVPGAEEWKDKGLISRILHDQYLGFPGALR